MILKEITINGKLHTIKKPSNVIIIQKECEVKVPMPIYELDLYSDTKPIFKAETNIDIQNFAADACCQNQDGFIGFISDAMIQQGCKKLEDLEICLLIRNSKLKSFHSDLGYIFYEYVPKCQIIVFSDEPKSFLNEKFEGLVLPYYIE